MKFFSENKMLNISYTQLKRLESIDFRLYFYGFFSRKEIALEFNVRDEAVSRDIAIYKEQNPKSLIYDKSKRRYVKTQQFKPAYEHSFIDAITTFAREYNEFSHTHESGISIYTKELSQPIKLQVFSVITQAIAQKKVLEIDYFSIEGGKSTRQIVPFSITTIGSRYYLRAYCRKRSKFISFVMSRIQSPKVIEESPILDIEKYTRDIHWNNVVTLELIPHPKLKNPEFVLMDYNIEDGILVTQVKSAFAAFFLKLWNIDCSANNELNEKTHHLYLKNNYVLETIENKFIAPGVRDDYAS